MFVLKRGTVVDLVLLKLKNLMLINQLKYIDGRKENVFFDKITSRIVKLCYGLNMDYIDPVSFLNFIS